MLNTVLYMEIDLFAALVVLIIMDFSKNSLLRLDQRLFRMEQVLLIIELCLDSLCWPLLGAKFPGAHILSVSVNFLGWLFMLFPYFVGVLYAYAVAHHRLNRRLMIISFFPVLVGIIVLLFNFKTGWVFSVDQANIYHRGPYFLAFPILSFIDMFIAVGVTLHAWRQAPTYERRKLMALTFFLIIPIAGVIPQLLQYGIVTIWVFLTLSILMCHVHIQRGDLATDQLTGLNNRRRFDSYSAEVFGRLKGDSNMWLLVLDIDKFKNINDALGHPEGDSAIIKAAQVLKQAMENHRGFLARIGGDEFAIILKDVGECDVRSLIDHLDDVLLKANRHQERDYELTFSIGYAEATGNTKESFRTLFAEADRRMYAQKSSL